MIRRSIAAAALMAVSVFTGAAGAAQPAYVGTADAKITIGEVTLPGVASGGVELGWVRSFSSTDADSNVNPLGGGKPYAIAGAKVAGEEVSVNSQGGGTSPGRQVALPEGAGSVDVGQVTASADAASARSAIDAVQAQVAAALVGMDFGIHDFSSVVDAQGARSGNTITVEGISVGLDDILPAELLAALPLEALMSVLDDLPVDLPLGQLEDALDTVRELVASAKAVDTASAAVDTARAARDEAVASRPSLSDAVTAAESTLSDLNSQAASLTAEIEDLESEIATTSGLVDAACGLIPLPTCSTLQAELAALESELASTQAELSEVESQIPGAQTAVTDAKAALAEVDAVIDAAEAELLKVVAILDDAVDTLLDLARDVEALDLSGLLHAVIDGLSGIELIGIEDLTAGVASASTASSSNAAVVCEVAGVRILGQAQPATDCTDLTSHFSQVKDVIGDILAALPLDTDVLPADLVTVAAPRGSATGANHAVDGVYMAQAQVSPLVVKVTPAVLTGTVDGLLSTITDLADGALAELAGLTGISVPVDAEAVLADLQATLDSLPTAELVQGTSIPGVDINLGTLLSSAQFGPQEKTGKVPLPTDPPATPAAPGTPSTPVPGGNLPTTGGGVGLALVLLALGGAATWTTVVRPARAR